MLFNTILRNMNIVNYKLKEKKVGKVTKTANLWLSTCGAICVQRHYAKQYNSHFFFFLIFKVISSLVNYHLSWGQIMFVRPNTFTNEYPAFKLTKRSIYYTNAQLTITKNTERLKTGTIKIKTHLMNDTRARLPETNTILSACS